SEHEDVPQPSKPNFATNFLNKVRNSLFVYPEGHPMNHIKEIEVDLFGHLQAEDIPPISKRRKMLRRFERKKAHSMQVAIATRGLAIPTSSIDRPHYDHAGNTFWDMDGEEPELEWCPDYMLPSDLPLACKTKHGLPPSNRNDHHPGEKNFNVQSDLRNLRSPKNRNEPIGPRNQHLYTIRDNNIVRLEHVDQDQGDEYRAVDIVVPENPAEEMLLEAPTVSQEQVSLLFNQFVLANGGPINVRLMTSGRMRGQAFVEFQALSEANGTILSGRPIIAQFARNTNHRPG
ncbi:RNA-binding protein 41, partial [Operophtera brumata]